MLQKTLVKPPIAELYNSTLFLFSRYFWFKYAFTVSNNGDATKAYHKEALKTLRKIRQLLKPYMDDRRYQRLQSLTRRLSIGSLKRIHIIAEFPYIIFILRGRVWRAWGVFVIIFSEEENRVYLDNFETIIPSSIDLNSVGAVIRHLYGTDEFTVRLQGDLFLKYKPLKDLKKEQILALLQDLFESEVRLYAGRNIDVWRSIYYELMSRHPKFFRELYNWWVLRRLYYKLIYDLYPREHSTIFFLNVLEDSRKREEIMQDIKNLEQKMLNVLREIENRLVDYLVSNKNGILNSKFKISLRRTSGGNDHTVYITGFPFANISPWTLRDYFGYKIPETTDTNKLLVFLVPGDVEVIVEHKEHETARQQIKDPGLVVIYLP